MSADTPYQVPLFDLNYGREEEEAVVQTLQSRWISMGPKVAELEAALAAALGAPHALAVTNCTAALHLAMLVMNIGPGDEVIVPSLTFVATVNAIRYVGATPVFADIAGPADLNLDPAGLEALITSRTRAIVVMHYGGFPCAMDEIGAIISSSSWRMPVMGLCRSMAGTSLAPLATWAASASSPTKTSLPARVGCFSPDMANITVGDSCCAHTG